MADHALFYNSVDHDRVYNADSFSDWLKKFFTTGVFTGDLFVSAAGSMNVSVGTGYVNINGKVMIYGAATTLTLEPANGIYPRIDTIVVERNDTDRDFFLKVVTGDYANLNDPVPTPPVRSGAIYQLVLAQIYVGAGVTEITQANITDTRADDDLCGIVTGTVEEMDFSQFAAQFAEYYQEFQNGYEADFENWSDAQRQNFANWMADEENTFDTWFANLHYVLDGDVAGHLQNEIDEIKAGMSGSILNIHTNESTLVGKTVTVTGATQTLTATISNSGDAQVLGLMDVGNVTITASDGTDTATTVINIPYFSNYPVTLAFWQATVNIQGDENIYGETVSVSNSSHILVETITLDPNDGTGVFYASRPDTYTISVEYEGETYSESVTVSEETTYSVELMTMPNGETVTPTDDIQIWLKCAGITDKSYTTLNEVLADSETYNALLGDSNACAYMKRSTTWSTDICADQYAMNLLGQYDTACDALLSDATWTTALNNSSYWYGHTDSGVLIHGGNPTYDSFYRIVDGNHVPVTDPSLLDEGTYTIYSNGLAKDPDNLSNDYGKTIRICPNTKEIVVRPDNSLYWYGHESTTLLMAPNDAFNKSTYSLDLNTTAYNGSNVTSSPIDVSDASTLHEVITIGATHKSGHPIQLECLVNAPTATFNLTNFKDVDIATYKGQISHQTMDISSYSGDRYLGIFMYATAATSAGGKVHAIWYE